MKKLSGCLRTDTRANAKRGGAIRRQTGVKKVGAIIIAYFVINLLAEISQGSEIDLEQRDTHELIRPDGSSYTPMILRTYEDLKSLNEHR